MSIPVSSIGRLEKACGEVSRPMITEPYLRITETVTGKGKTRKVERVGVLHATNSYIAVSITVPLRDDETEGVVPLVAIKFAKTIKGSEIRLIGGRAEVWSGGSEQGSFPRGDINEYPDFAKITPNGTPVVVFALNPQLLMDAADALGRTSYQALRIEVRDPLRPLCVSIPDDSEKSALVMPIRVRA